MNGSTDGGSFPQQIEPFTAVPEPGDGYGPMITSFLEYTALRLGIVPRPARNALLWSGLLVHVPGGSSATHTFTQRLGDASYTLVIGPSGAFTGSRNGKTLFTAWGDTPRADGHGRRRDRGLGHCQHYTRCGRGPSGRGCPEPHDGTQCRRSVDLVQHPPSSRLVREAPFVAPF